MGQNPADTACRTLQSAARVGDESLKLENNGENRQTRPNTKSLGKYPFMRFCLAALLSFFVFISDEASAAEDCYSTDALLDAEIFEIGDVEPCSSLAEYFLLGLRGVSRKPHVGNYDTNPEYYYFSKAYLGDKKTRNLGMTEAGDAGLLTLAIGFISLVDRDKMKIYNSYYFQQLGILNEKEINSWGDEGIDLVFGIRKSLFELLKDSGLQSLGEVQCFMLSDAYGTTREDIINSKLFKSCLDELEK